MDVTAKARIAFSEPSNHPNWREAVQGREKRSKGHCLDRRGIANASEGETRHRDTPPFPHFPLSFRGRTGANTSKGTLLARLIKGKAY